MNKISPTIFKACIPVAINKDFLHVLRNLGIKKSDISLTTRGDFILYDINLSAKNNISNIKKVLNQIQEKILKKIQERGL